VIVTFMSALLLDGFCLGKGLLSRQSAYAMSLGGVLLDRVRERILIAALEAPAAVALDALARAAVRLLLAHTGTLGGGFWRNFGVQVRIYVTGAICIESALGLIPQQQLPRRQGRLAFVRLVLERSRAVSTDELVDMLWPGQPPAAHLVAVSAVVSKLRRLLTRAGVDDDPVGRAFGCYQLRLPPGAWIDAEVALDSLHEAEAALRSGDRPRAYAPSVVAAAILRRPFLQGEYGEWVDAQRRKFDSALVRTLDCLATVHDWNGEPTLAIAAAREAVRREPFRESGYRTLLSLHIRSGNRAEAIRVYQECRALFASELGAAPSAEIEGLMATIGTPPTPG
jgi:SARP family transcriptional regulator, regulator of embCAB operon